jgi:hypothetical protein
MIGETVLSAGSKHYPRADMQIDANHGRKKMNFVTSLIAAAALLAPLSPAVDARAGAPAILAEDGLGAPLTLTGAKQAVSRYLDESGQHQLRVGNAAFNRDGNIAVDIVSLQGIPVRHVVVDAKSGAVADARTGATLTKKS